MSGASIDPSARIAAGAQIGSDVTVGPYCTIGPHVTVGDGCVLVSHVNISGHTVVGPRNKIQPFASLGTPPQSSGYRGEPTRLVIGADNDIREHVTMNTGTAADRGVTTVGDGCMFMVNSHVAHDCRVGNHTIFANAATLAGHVDVADHSTIGAFSAVHQFCRVGVYGFLGGYTVATKDVLPYSKTVGNRARIYGVNTLGLQRRGFPPEVIGAIRQAYRVLLQSRLNTSEALARLEAEPMIPEVRLLVDFIRSAKRGVVLRRASRHHVTDEG